MTRLTVLLFAIALSGCIASPDTSPPDAAHDAADSCFGSWAPPGAFCWHVATAIDGVPRVTEAPPGACTLERPGCWTCCEFAPEGGL